MLFGIDVALSESVDEVPEADFLSNFNLGTTCDWKSENKARDMR